MPRSAQPSDPLRILQVSAQFPFPARSGFETRVYQLARGLAARHDVTLLSYVDPGREDDVERLREEFGVEVVERSLASRTAKRTAQAVSAASRQPFVSRWLHSREMQRKIDDLCSSGRFDLVQLESSVLGAFGFPGTTALILDEHNIEYEVFARMHEGERSLPRRSFNRLEHARFRRFEQAWWRRADGCAVTSEREQRIVLTHAPETPTEVVPNGVDLDYFRPGADEPNARTAVFNGVLDYRPNLDAAYYLVESIWPLVLARCPDAQLEIVGRGKPADVEALRRRGIRVTGEVADLRPHLANAAVVVVPIRMGGGTRLKVVEGLAMGKAMVSTSLGCEGVNVDHGKHLLVADEPEPFAAAVVRLFEDRSLGSALGRAGRLRMEEEYSWERAATRLEELYGRALAGGRALASRRQTPTSAPTSSPKRPESANA